MKRYQEERIEKAVKIGLGIVAIAILCLFVAALVLGGLKLLNTQLLKEEDAARAAMPTPMPTIDLQRDYVGVLAATPTAEPTREPVTPTPAFTPDENGHYTALNSPTPSPIRSGFFVASNIQTDLLPCVLYTLYGSEVEILGMTTPLTPEGLYDAVIKLHHADECEEISVYEVDTGDVCYEDGVVGVCVGKFEGHPLFVYCAEDNYAAREYDVRFGMYIGYAECENDRLFCGCAPITGTKFYNSGYGKSNAALLDESIERFKKYDYQDFNILYDFGRAISNADEEQFLTMFYDQELSRNDLTFTYGYPRNFCKLFTVYAGADMYGSFSVIPRSVMQYEDFGHMHTQYECEVLSLDTTSFLERSGKWTFTVIDRGSEVVITPHGRDEGIIGVKDALGLVKETEAEIAIDEYGNEVYVFKDAKYGFTTDKDGNLIYKAEDGTVISGFDGRENILVGEEGVTDELMNMLEKAGYILDREKKAYYEGEYWDYKGKRYYGVGTWFDIATNEKVSFESEGLYEWWFYVEGTTVYFYYNKEEKNGETKYWAGAFYALTEDGKLFRQMYDSRTGTYEWFAEGTDKYELVYEWGDYYINNLTASKKYMYRLIPEGEDKEMWLCQ